MEWLRDRILWTPLPHNETTVSVFVCVIVGAQACVCVFISMCSQNTPGVVAYSQAIVDVTAWAEDEV